MKLVAFRAKDRPDIRLLIRECGLIGQGPAAYAMLLRDIYPGEGELAHVLGVRGADENETEVELRYIAESAAAMGSVAEG